MFFGRGNASENVQLKELAGTLNRLFNEKLRLLEAKGANLIKELKYNETEFVNACDDFEALSAEPDLDYIYTTNTGFIKSQKSSYAKNLKHIMSSTPIIDNPIIYSKYSAVLYDTELKINSVLKNNSLFKMVVLAYANHLSNFKRVFSSMERLRNTIRREIENYNEEYSEYKTTMDNVQSLLAMEEELHLIKENEQTLKSKPSTHGLRSEEAELKEKITKKTLEIEEIDGKIAGISSRIEMLLSPLNRAARKYDHLSLEKTKLMDLMNDPVGKIATEQDYNKFADLVNGMKKEINLGRIDVKNTKEAEQQIAKIFNENLYALIQDKRSLSSRRSSIHEELRSFQAIMQDIEENERREKSYADTISDIAKRIGELQKSQSSLKNTTEALFLRCYKKRINIIL